MTRSPPEARSDRQLSEVFRERGGAAAMDDAEVERTLGRLFAEGARAWPGLGVSAEAFVRHLASRRGQGELAKVRAADMYLACACAEGARGALEAFDQAYLRRMDAFLARTRPTPAFVDEVRQALRDKLFMGRDGAPPRIVEYDGHGSLESWVRVVALRTAVDLRRQAGAVRPPDDRPRDEPAAVDPEIGYVKQRYRRAWSAAFRGAVAALDADDHELLRLRFVEGLTQAEVAARLGIHRATVVRRLDAAQAAIAKEARRLLRAELRASEAELDSLAGVMRSQIELSLPGLLKAR